MTEPQLTGPSYGPASGNPPRQLVVFLHGRGADGDDLIGLAPIFAKHFPDALFLSPHAPERCDDVPFGLQWFSRVDWVPENIANGVRGAAPALDAFLDHHLAAHGLDDSKLALFGFSQGCMMALHVGLRRKAPPAAVLGFSGRLAAAESLADEITARPPVLLVHGDADMVVPYDSLAAAEKVLKDLAVPVEAVTRPGLGHSLDNDGI
ncbi:MAG: prolyl oligopeptidase family serine peptidase, partial [Proteobacteria bacterium]|nr:prolyl oligopeptidase family serine peptidase [Pseudomonadota bacterium]